MSKIIRLCEFFLTCYFLPHNSDSVLIQPHLSDISLSLLRSILLSHFLSFSLQSWFCRHRRLYKKRLVTWQWLELLERRSLLPGSCWSLIPRDRVRKHSNGFGNNVVLLFLLSSMYFHSEKGYISHSYFVEIWGRSFSYIIHEYLKLSRESPL